jgi:hypothetical protein
MPAVPIRTDAVTRRPVAVHAANRFIVTNTDADADFAIIAAAGDDTARQENRQHRHR